MSKFDVNKHTNMAEDTGNGLHDAGTNQVACTSGVCRGD